MKRWSSSSSSSLVLQCLLLQRLLLQDLLLLHHNTRLLLLSWSRLLELLQLLLRVEQLLLQELSCLLQSFFLVVLMLHAFKQRCVVEEEERWVGLLHAHTQTLLLYMLKPVQLLLLRLLLLVLEHCSLLQLRCTGSTLARRRRVVPSM